MMRTFGTHPRVGRRVASLSLLFVLLLADNTRAFPEIDTTGFGNELASLSDGGAFGRGSKYRQSFCERYEEMVSGNSTLNVATALRGKEISVSASPGQYFQYDNETGIDPDYPGVNARMLDYIAARGGFTWRQSFGVWTREEKGNRSITDILVWGAEKYDVMVGTYTPSTERMKRAVSFVDGHFDGTLIMVRDVPPPQVQIRWFNWLRPFETGVWIVLLVIIIVSSFAYQLIEAIGGKRRESHGDGSFRSWTMANMYKSFINFTANYSYEPTTLGGQIFGVSFAFWAMLISAAYTANLASLLVVRATLEPIVNDIQDVIDQQLPICVHATSYSETYLKERYPGIEPYLVLKPVKELYNSLNSGECEIMVAYKQDFEASLRRESDNPRCTLEWQGRQVQPLVDGFATKLDPAVLCTDLVNEVFNYYIKEMTDNGYLEHIWQEHSAYYSDEGHCEAKRNKNDNRRLSASNPEERRLAAAGAKAAKTASSASDNDGDEESNALTLKDMAGTLLFQVMTTLIAIFVALVSGCDKKTKAKRIESRLKDVPHTLDFSETSGEEGRCSNDNNSSESTVQQELRDIKQQIGQLMAMVQQLQDNMDENQQSRRQFRAVSSISGTLEPDNNSVSHLSHSPRRPTRSFR